MNTWVILDRDGVINEESPQYIKSPAEWLPIPGSVEAIAALSQAGYKVVIVTNQSGIGRGYYDEATLAAIHDKLIRQLESAEGRLEHIFYCPHHPDAGCACRKPQTGLLQEMAKRYSLPFPFTAPIPFIGDTERDLRAALSSGCLPILVLTGHGQRTLEKLQEEQSDLLDRIQVFPNLHEAVQHKQRWILPRC